MAIAVMFLHDISKLNDAERELTATTNVVKNKEREHGFPFLCFRLVVLVKNRPKSVAIVKTFDSTRKVSGKKLILNGITFLHKCLCVSRKLSFYFSIYERSDIKTDIYVIGL